MIARVGLNRSVLLQAAASAAGQGNPPDQFTSSLASRATMETALSTRRSCHTRESEPLQDPRPDSCAPQGKTSAAASTKPLQASEIISRTPFKPRSSQEAAAAISTSCRASLSRTPAKPRLMTPSGCDCQRLAFPLSLKDGLILGVPGSIAPSCWTVRDSSLCVCHPVFC